MLRQVTGEDLIAKEFKMHLNCYKDCTKVCSKQSLDGVSSLSVDEGSENETRTANNFKTVCSFIVDHVIGGHLSVSIKVLTEMYGFDKEDNRLRSKVKQRIENEFGDKIAFVNISYHEPEIVVSRSVLEDTCVSNFIKENKKFISKESARHIRSDITEMISKAPELPWPKLFHGLTDSLLKVSKNFLNLCFIQHIIHLEMMSVGMLSHFPKILLMLYQEVTS